MFPMNVQAKYIHLNHSLVQLTPSKSLTQLQEYSYGWDPIIQTPLFIQGVSASQMLLRTHMVQVGSGI